MLLGQTVNAYRSDGPRLRRPARARATQVPGLRRLRFTTSHPSHVTERLGARAPRPARASARTCTCRSSRARTACSARCGAATRARSTWRRSRMLREHVPGLALSSDVIVGYPGETPPSSTPRSRSSRSVGFDGLFSFSYSPRPGTTAIRLADDVPEAEKKRRLTRAERAPAAVAAAPQRIARRARATRCSSRRSTAKAASPAARRTSGSCISTVGRRSPRPDGRRRDHRCRIQLAPGTTFATDSLTVVSAVPIFRASGGVEQWKSR